MSSYFVMATMSRNTDLRDRCKAAASAEIAAGSQHSAVMQNWLRQGGMDQPMCLITARGDWVSAWSSALISARAEDAPTIGSDGSVITDSMILSAVVAVAAM